MKSITTALRQRIVASVIRGAWSTIRAGQYIQALGELLEAWADRRAGAEAALLIATDALRR